MNNFKLFFSRLISFRTDGLRLFTAGSFEPALSRKVSDLRQVEYDPTPMMYAFCVCIQDPYTHGDSMEILLVDMDVCVIYTYG